MQVIIVNSNSVESYFSPKLKSPGLLQSIQTLTDIVLGVKTAVESMDKRLQALESLLSKQVSKFHVHECSTIVHCSLACLVLV